MTSWWRVKKVDTMPEGVDRVVECNSCVRRLNVSKGADIPDKCPECDYDGSEANVAVKGSLDPATPPTGSTDD